MCAVKRLATKNKSPEHRTTVAWHCVLQVDFREPNGSPRTPQHHRSSGASREILEAGARSWAEWLAVDSQFWDTDGALMLRSTEEQPV